MRGGPGSPTVGATMLRRLLAAALLTALVAPPAALAQAPAGDWTLVRKDAFKHYACRTKEKDGDYTVRTSTFDNGEQDAVDQGIGAYTAIARGSNKNVVDAADEHSVERSLPPHHAAQHPPDRPALDAGVLLRPGRALVGRARRQEARALRPALRALAVL